MTHNKSGLKKVTNFDVNNFSESGNRNKISQMFHSTVCQNTEVLFVLSLKNMH
uniref:Uncharacterized protein n=1 Tax=Anguilla anguilla TaxID=7936 RepID=A0A0E9WRH6_ANGAN